MSITTRKFLEEAALTKEIIDRFLDPNAHNWATFDAELGYVLHNSTVKDGLDGSYSIYRYHPSGERRLLNFAEQPCRINTYGDSFTQCHQVSDGETWQEYLAAHLGEPIRNFGVGGYGIYQAYRRMLKEETKSSAEYVILNIWSDDHFRSIYKWRWIHIPGYRRNLPQKNISKTEACMFHANPWAHLRLNPESGEFEECENPYSTPESLYQLCDKEHIYENFKDDFEVQAFLAQQNVTDIKIEILQRMAEVLEIPADFSSPEATAKTAQALLRECAFRASMYIVDKAKAFAKTEGKKFMILLSYSSGDVINACKNIPRFDQLFVNYLKENEFLFVDVLQKHVEDFKVFNCSPEEYVQRYYIGHYNPNGNHFFAFAVKNDIVKWLEPKPPTYREEGPSLQTLAAKLA
ncbi:SGNH/GDSL hydrolase family protein [Candidatus Poribacteria bacterium]|nr:SGNH/GDSL hydrolase family protein [Candidatus Poribacteria bacterium]